MRGLAAIRALAEGIGGGPIRQPHSRGPPIGAPVSPVRRARVRYHFNLAGAVSQPDEKGHELANLSGARIAAVKYAAEYLRDRPELVWLGEEFRIEVTDDNRDTLFTFIAVGVDAPAKTGRLRL